MKKNQNGFSAVEALMITVIVAAVGFVGWYVWHNRSTTAPNTKTVSEPSKELKSYTDPVFNYSFKYPADWKVSTEKDDHWGKDMLSTLTTITDPSEKNQFVLRADYGGRGGNCVPASGDALFAENNFCASKQVLDEFVTMNKLTTLDPLDQLSNKHVINYFAVDKTKFRDPHKSTEFLYELTYQNSVKDLATFKAGVMGPYGDSTDVLINTTTGKDSFFYLASMTKQPGSSEAYFNEAVPKQYSQILQSITLGSPYEVE